MKTVVVKAVEYSLIGGVSHRVRPLTASKSDEGAVGTAHLYMFR